MTTTAYAAVGLTLCETARSHTASNVCQQISSNSVIASVSDDVMAKVIEFYARDLFPTKVKSVPHDRRGKVIEFPKDKPAVAGKTANIRERDQDEPIAASWPGCF